MPLPRHPLTILLYILILLITYTFLTLIHSLSTLLSTNPFSLTQKHTWSSPHSTWYSLSTPHPSPSTIHLNITSLILLSQDSCWGTDYIRLALFTPVLCLTKTGLLRLSRD